MIQELDSAIEATAAADKGEKRKMEDGGAGKSSAPKKIVLNRNPSVSSDIQNGSGTTEAVGDKKSTGNSEKKIIKLSELSVKEVRQTYLLKSM